ncbi:helix-turn-helix domain-containing protein [Ralstonia solanacearum]|uniref:helix-turn-helix domain-containing protein n=1 Tax=Ralstonia solanacearum TaxID=305 RepID=UPI001E4322CE|nr:helix-turn-helix domain-containing protein [Ralstonia solanacearum]
MPKPETITMTMRELDRFKIVQTVVDQGLPVWHAAERLGVSRRQVERLVLRLQEDGPSALVARKRGRPSNRQLPPGLESRTRGLIRDSYADFGPTLVAEKLRERHGIEISKACVRRIMIDAGFWMPRKLRQLRRSARQTAPVPFTNPGHALILDETHTSWGNLPAG